MFFLVLGLVAFDEKGDDNGYLELVRDIISHPGIDFVRDLEGICCWRAGCVYRKIECRLGNTFPFLIHF